MLASLAGHAGLRAAVLHSCSVVHRAAGSSLLQSPLGSLKDVDPEASVTLGTSKRPMSCASCASRTAPLHLTQLLGPSLLRSTGAVWEAHASPLTADTRCQLSAAVADKVVWWRSYQPPPRHLVPYAAALKGQGNRCSLIPGIPSCSAVITHATKCPDNACKLQQPAQSRRSDHNRTTEGL